MSEICQLLQTPIADKQTEKARRHCRQIKVQCSVKTRVRDESSVINSQKKDKRSRGGSTSITSTRYVWLKDESFGDSTEANKQNEDIDEDNHDPHKR